MIQISNISKAFSLTSKKKKEEQVLALDNVSLTIADSEFVSIIGPSGCGKTTLLKMLGGLVKPDSGTLSIDGIPVTGPGSDRAIVFQNFALMPWSNVLRNVAFGLELKDIGKGERESISREWIKSVGLQGFEKHYPHQLSGGMQQRVGLARALAVNPRILLMDEPFGALDAQTRQVLQEDLMNIWQKDRKTALFITHAMDEAVFLSDRVVIMSPRPGKVQEILSIDLPRSRTEYNVRETKQFTEYTAYIWNAMHQFVAHA